jgi:hypothetical protein
VSTYQMTQHGEIDLDDPLAVRFEAERLVGEDRVDHATLREIVEQYGATEPDIEDEDES